MRVKLTASGSDRKWQKTRQLLGWIASAKRPLKMHELQAIISIEPTKKLMNYDHNTLKAHITECCGSLVHMVGDDQVELVHHTARESVNSFYVYINSFQLPLSCTLFSTDGT